MERDRQRQLFGAGVITPSALEKAESAVKIYASQEQAALLLVAGWLGDADGLRGLALLRP